MPETVSPTQSIAQPDTPVTEVPHGQQPVPEAPPAPPTTTSVEAPPPEPPPEPIPETKTPQPPEPKQTPPPPPNEPPTPPPVSEIAGSGSSGKKKSIIKIIFIILIVLILLLGTAVGALGMVAYNKVDIGNKDLQSKISVFVQDLPMTPKTVPYLLYKSSQASDGILSARMDISVASDSQGLAKMAGLQNFDVSLNGFFDGYDEKSPQVQFTLESPQLKGEMIYKDKKYYFRVDSIPDYVSNLLMSESPVYLDVVNNVVLGKWIYVDDTTMDTEARQYITEKGTSAQKDQHYLDALEKTIGESDVINNVTLQEADVDGSPAYEIGLSLNGDEIGKLYDDYQRRVAFDSPSTVTTADYGKVDDLSVKLWIDKSNYYVRKITISVRVNVAGLQNRNVLGVFDSRNEQVDSAELFQFNEDYVELAFVIKLSQFNEKFNVVVPPSAMSSQDVVGAVQKRMMELMQQQVPLDEDRGGFYNGGSGNTPVPSINGGSPSSDYEGFAE